MRPAPCSCIHAGIRNRRPRVLYIYNLEFCASRRPGRARLSCAYWDRYDLVAVQLLHFWLFAKTLRENRE
jgi:hypothetical protein